MSAPEKDTMRAAVVWGVFLKNGRFMDKASDDKQTAIDMAEAFYGADEYDILPLTLTLPPTGGEPVAVEPQPAEEAVREAVIDRLRECDVGMINLPVSYLEVRKRIREAIAVIAAPSFVVPANVVALVVAARAIIGDPGPEDFQRLDKAVEAFGSRVPYDASDESDILAAISGDRP